MTAPEALAFLARERRTVLLGGAAVILHGMNRSTKDFDIWMDPHPDADTWAAPIGHLLEQVPSLCLLRIAPPPQLWISAFCKTRLKPLTGTGCERALQAKHRKCWYALRRLRLLHSLLKKLVHQVRDWYSSVAIKMGRRQGATKEHI
jgi:hypothetical protein